MNKIPFNTEPPDGGLPSEADGARAKLLCPMPIQKETPNGLVDTVCNSDIGKHQAGLCRYLCDFNFVSYDMYIY